MMSNRYFAFLCCLIAVIVSSQAQSPTKSPECAGMNRAKLSLEKGIRIYTKEPINCLVNKACTGLSCNGTHKSDPFYMSVQLKHCIKAGPEIHLDLIYKKYKVNVHRELKQGSSIDLYSLKALKVKLKLNLERRQNIIKVKLELENCINLPGGSSSCSAVQTLLPETMFCVNMDTCQKGMFNTTGYTPCHVPATPTHQSAKTPILSTPNPTEPLGAKRHSEGDGHHHISVGEAVGIGFAVLAAILIVIGVLIYWKKFHHRSRLRAAYYNDISMNDPLYEDFGPEVA